MHSALRLTTLLATAAATLAASAATASAGQLVYSYQPADGDAQIRVMDDDGANDRLLVHEDDIPGAEAVYSPYVSPDGATVVFMARTPAPGAGGLYCGFRCAAIYAYRDGAITRISQAATPCPGGDDCFGLDTGPRITGGGEHVFYELLYGEPGSSGTPSTIRTNYLRSMAPGDGGEVEVPQTECGRGDNVTPNPAADGDYAITAYCFNGTWSLKVAGMDGGEQTVVNDDEKFEAPAFRGDGQALVSAEGGGDPGLWTYSRDGSAINRVAELSWNGDHAAYETSPTFMGNDRIAFVYDERIRTVSTSCASCTLAQTADLGARTGIDTVAWTSRDIASPAVGGGTGGDGTGAGGSDGGTGGGATGGGATPKPPVPPVTPVTPVKPITPVVSTPATLKAPAKAKLPSALRGGLVVPFAASRTGRLTMEAVLAPAQARKLRLTSAKRPKPVVVATGAVTVTEAGAGTVTLRFTRAAKRRLKRARSVPLTLRGTFAGETLSGTTRLAK